LPKDTHHLSTIDRVAVSHYHSADMRTITKLSGESFQAPAARYDPRLNSLGVEDVQSQVEIAAPG
jgi:hypothetical protein